MAINDPVFVRFRQHKGDWILVRGKETFYDENDELRTFPGEYQARQWAIENLGVDPADNPIGANLTEEAKRRRERDRNQQPRLL